MPMDAQAQARLCDDDPQETDEWRAAFLALLQGQGAQRARYILDELARLARSQRVGWQPELATSYINTIGVEQQPVFPGDLAVEERLASLMRWNALAMVVRANQAYGELGGHIASYASAADLFEVVLQPPHLGGGFGQLLFEDLVFLLNTVRRRAQGLDHGLQLSRVGCLGEAKTRALQGLSVGGVGLLRGRTLAHKEANGHHDGSSQ